MLPAQPPLLRLEAKHINSCTFLLYLKKYCSTFAAHLKEKYTDVKHKIVDTLSYKTRSANANTVYKQWIVVDAAGLPLGRLASEVAKRIRGKHKPNFTPHVDCGDNVIVINAEQLQLSGDKWKSKIYLRHTGYPGGQRALTAEQLYAKSPARLVENAVRGMLPKNKLGAVLFRNLHVFNGAEHTHAGQNPTAIQLNNS